MSWSVAIFSALVFFAFVVPKAQGQEFLSDAGPAGQHHYRILLRTASEHGSESEIHGLDTASKSYEGVFYLPILQLENETYALTAKARKLRFNALPTDAGFMPRETLASYHTGFAWTRSDGQGDAWGLMGNYGSASDDPFSGADVQAMDLTVTRKKKKSETDSWIYFINYSNNRSVLNHVPLPGFAYAFSDSEKTRGGVLGIPFLSYWWRPTPKAFASVVFLMPSSAQAQAGYLVWGPVQANLKVEYGQLVFMRAGRSEEKERIFYDMKKIAVSLKTFLGRATFGELEVSRLIGRSMFDGRSAFQPTSDATSR